MEDITKQLEEKRAELKQLKQNQSEANCSTTHSSAADMHREMDMEDLEDQIKALENQVNN